jgi:hypothetical protein
LEARSHGKRLEPGKAKWPLYDISRDISEEINLAKSHPERLAALVKLWDQMNADMVDPLF